MASSLAPYRPFLIGALAGLGAAAVAAAAFKLLSSGPPRKKALAKDATEGAAAGGVIGVADAFVGCLREALALLDITAISIDEARRVAQFGVSFGEDDGRPGA